MFERRPSDSRIDLSGLQIRNGFSAGAAFSPLDITGLNGWYDFSDAATLFTDDGRTIPVTTDGDVIGGVTDKGGLAHHLAQATTGAKPLYKTNIHNGKSVCLFDGTDDFLRSSGWSSIAGVYVIAVIKPITWTLDRYLWDGQAAVRVALNMSATTPNLRQQTGPAANALAFALNTMALCEANYHDEPASFVRRNASTIASGGDITQNAVTGIIFGGRGDVVPTRFCNYQLGEWLIYDSEPTSAEMTSLQNYLNTKWVLF